MKKKESIDLKSEWKKLPKNQKKGFYIFIILFSIFMFYFVSNDVKEQEIAEKKEKKQNQITEKKEKIQYQIEEKKEEKWYKKELKKVNDIELVKQCFDKVGTWLSKKVVSIGINKQLTHDEADKVFRDHINNEFQFCSKMTWSEAIMKYKDNEKVMESRKKASADIDELLITYIDN